MKRRMKRLRGYAAALTAIVGFGLCMAALWTFTRLPAQDVLAWSGACALASVSVFWEATEPRRRRRRPQLYDLKKEWGYER